MGERALVLGGGGRTGFAWEIGVLAGLAEAGVGLADADLIVGTSAGAMAGVLLTDGADLERHYAGELTPDDATGPPLPAGFALRWGLTLLRHRDPRRFRARVGALALATNAGEAAERRAEVAGRLGGIRHWPRRHLLITAVDADTGDLALFDADRRVDLVDAVAASTAVPGLRSPVTIGGRRYIDAGVRSAANADVVAGHRRVVVLAPIVQGWGPVSGVAAEVDALRHAAEVVLVAPGRAARRALGRSVNELGDPARGPAAAREGRAQAATVAERIAEVWG
ncbi:patatin-like phospholipase family protein [Solihabitans fulvus]|uniref:Patatin-like phospholipase family protein n=1 Tax=Solihabitans fulvus TaxID=1892852 RepID=A0A5B2W840_9PSEU|nr:patatin-like phospholipase family protein [Solihabitans fulvus]KAA2246756.1 patatin-like phospholipase family protein [Solihabitans fulvus]